MSDGYWSFKEQRWITINRGGRKQAIPVSSRSRRNRMRVASVVNTASSHSVSELSQGVHLGGIRIEGKYYEIISGIPDRKSMSSAPIAVWEFPSKTTSNIYTTRLNDDNRLSCNCKGWTRRVDENGLRSCTHTARITARYSNT